LSINGKGATSSFADVSIPTITPTLLDMLRSQMNANCASSYVPPYNRCNWARDDLTNKLSDSVKGPFFSTTMDLLDAIRRADEADPNQILPQILARLVTPMKDGTGHLTQTPLEVIIDVIADVNRQDPSLTSKLQSPDYGAIAAQVSDFLMNKQFGLEQFYE